MSAEENSPVDCFCRRGQGAKVHGSAPKKSFVLRHKAHRNFDRITVDFFYSRKPLNIRVRGQYLLMLFFIRFLHSRQHI